MTNVADDTAKRRKSTIDAPRTAGGFKLDVNDPRIVLVTDRDHYLYSPRVHYKPTPDIGEALAQGNQTKPITLQKDGEDRWLVVDGRQEIISGRAHSKKHGVDILVECVFKKFKSNAEARIFSIKADLRVSDDPMSHAERVHTDLKILGDKKTVADAWSVSVATVDNWLSLLDLSDDVKEKVRDRTIDAVNARKLTVLPREKQTATVKEMVAVGATRGAPAGKAIAEAKAGKKVTGVVVGKKMLTRDFVTDYLSYLEVPSGDRKSAATNTTTLAVINTLKALLGDKDVVAQLPAHHQAAWKKALKDKK